MPRYKATAPGYLPDQGYIAEGTEFTTDAPKGSWMEEIPTGKPKPADDEPEKAPAGKKGK